MPAPEQSQSRSRGSTTPRGCPNGTGRSKDRPSHGSARDDRDGHAPPQPALTAAASGPSAGAFQRGGGYGFGVRVDELYPRLSTDATEGWADSCLLVTFPHAGPAERRPSGFQSPRRSQTSRRSSYTVIGSAKRPRPWLRIVKPRLAAR